MIEEILLAWQQALTNAGSSVINSLVDFLPSLLGALILFLFGLALANWCAALTVKLLGAVNLSAYFKDSPLEKFLKQADVSTKAELVAGRLVKLVINTIFFVADVNLLGLTTVTQVLNSLLAYVPNVLAAIFILVLGIIVAGLVESLVKGSLGAFDFKTARLLAKLSSYMIMVFAVLAALAQLKIAESFINTLFTGFVAMLALGLGLSLGLGSKDLVGRILNKWYDKFTESI